MENVPIFIHYVYYDSNARVQWQAFDTTLAYGGILSHCFKCVCTSKKLSQKAVCTSQHYSTKENCRARKLSYESFFSIAVQLFCWHVSAIPLCVTTLQSTSISIVVCETWQCSQRQVVARCFTTCLDSTFPFSLVFNRKSAWLPISFVPMFSFWATSLLFSFFLYSDLVPHNGCKNQLQQHIFLDCFISLSLFGSSSSTTKAQIVDFIDS